MQRKDQRSTATKQVRLKLVYLDFWSVVKLSFLIWLCLGIVLIIATFLIWIVLDGPACSARSTRRCRTSSARTTSASTNSFGLGQVVLFSFVIAILNLVLGTVLGAIAALLYNLSVRITGGLLVGFQNA